jgi:putative solute:sodium symporter small subunit
MRSHRQYWRRNLVAIALCLALWALVTFGATYYGRELSQFDFFGWPFSFWVGAQGTLIVYLGIIVFYARYMNRLDDEYAQGESADQSISERNQ